MDLWDLFQGNPEHKDIIIINNILSLLSTKIVFYKVIVYDFDNKCMPISMTKMLTVCVSMDYWLCDGWSSNKILIMPSVGLKSEVMLPMVQSVSIFVYVYWKLIPYGFWGVLQSLSNAYLGFTKCLAPNLTSQVVIFLPSFKALNWLWILI